MSQTEKGLDVPWNPVVLENRIFMLLPIVFNPESTLDAAASQGMNAFVDRLKAMPAQAFHASTGALFPQWGMPPEAPADSPLWADLPGDATDDFHRFVRQIAGVSRADADPAFARPLRVASESLFSQRKGGKPRLFTVPLTAAATRRCGRSALSLQLAAPTLYSFSSGMAVVVLEWLYVNPSHAEPVRALDVLEGNYVLSHPSRAKSQAQGGPDGPVAMTPESVVQLVQALLPALQDQAGAARLGIQSERRFLYSSLRIEPETGDNRDMLLSLFARRLARRETTDYQPSLETLAQGQFSPFANVRHVAAIEGGCTLIEAGTQQAEFLRNLIRDRVRNTYLPLAMVSLHAHFWLMTITQSLPDSTLKADLHAEKKSLESLQEKLINFRKIFHFSVASQISQHNDFHDAWQTQLRIDQQLVSLTELSNAASSMVQEKRIRQISELSGFIGGFLLGKEVLGILREKLTVSAYEWQSNLVAAVVHPDAHIQAELQQTVHSAEVWEWGVFIGAALCGFVGYWIARHFGIKGGRE